MAVQQGYGKMAGANSLVFAYDTTDTTNSFKGRPTSNLLETGTNWSYMGATITDPNNYPIPLPQNVKFYTGGSNGALSWTDACRNYVDSYPAGTKITVSGWHMVYSTDTSLAIDGRLRLGWHYNKDGVSTYGGTIYTVTEWNKWTYFSHTFSSTGVTTNLRVEDGGYDYYLTAEDASKTSQYYCNLQIEIGDGIASEYVKGTRSATEGLLDLTGNHTIDISNVSFNNGNIDFDGTSDFIETSLITTNSSNITSISWVYLEDWYSPNSTIGLSVDSGGPNGGYRVYNTQSNLGVWMRRSDGNGVSSISGNYRIPRKQWVQVAFVNDNGTGKIYVNDHVAISGTFTLPGLVNGPAWISRYSGGGYYLNGSVENVALYNRALSEAEIIANFNRNKKKHIGADCLLDHTTDGGGWIRFWWYTGVGWPGHETEALGHPFGTFDSSSHYGFQRLPEGLAKEQVELLAKDGIGNIYKWDFASPSATAQQVWDSFTQGIQGRWNNNGDAWDPEVIAGSFFNTPQDSWQYRDSEGVVSFLLDDDTCDCKSTLNAGHAMCGSGWNQTYAQPDGAYLRYGVDILNDDGCRGPVPENTLELFYRLK